MPVFTKRRWALSLLLEMFFMWKAMMFSVWPVRTASAALKTRRQTVRYQSSDTIKEWVRECVFKRLWVGWMSTTWDHQGKTKVNKQSKSQNCKHKQPPHLSYLIPKSVKQSQFWVSTFLCRCTYKGFWVWNGRFRKEREGWGTSISQTHKASTKSKSNCWLGQKDIQGIDIISNLISFSTAISRNLLWVYVLLLYKRGVCVKQITNT